MLHKITPGNLIDVATPAEVASIVGQAISGVQGEEDIDYYAAKGAVILNASGNGELVFTAPRMYNWQIERVTAQALGGPTLYVFENKQQIGNYVWSDLLEVIAISGTVNAYSDSFSNNLWLPAGSTAWVVFSGGTAATSASIRLQIRQRKVKNYNALSSSAHHS